MHMGPTSAGKGGKGGMNVHDVVFDELWLPVSYKVSAVSPAPKMYSPGYRFWQDAQ